MLVYIGKRLVFMVFVLFGITVITFMLTQIVPGNPARLTFIRFGKRTRYCYC